MDQQPYTRLNKLFPWKSGITLRHTPLRTDEARREFAMYGFDDVGFYFADKSFNPIEGCFMSHYNVMRQALMDNTPYALVFEDDVKFNVNMASMLPKIYDELQDFLDKKKFDILYLGWCAGYGSFLTNCMMNSKKLPEYEYIFESKCSCTHAVVYSRRFMNYFVSNYKFYSDANFQGHIDQLFLKIPNIQMFMVVPSMFDQKWCYSVMDYGKFKCQDEKKFSKEKFVNNYLYYQKYFTSIVIACLLFIIILFLLRK